LLVAVIPYSYYHLLIDSVNLALDAEPENINLQATMHCWSNTISMRLQGAMIVVIFTDINTMYVTACSQPIFTNIAIRFTQIMAYITEESIWVNTVNGIMNPVNVVLTVWNMLIGMAQVISEIMIV
jgi:hypothetical protein